MTGILDRIKKAEAARAAVVAARRQVDLEAMTDAELIADLGRVQAEMGMTADQIARYGVFFAALDANESAAQHAMERYRSTQTRTPIDKLTHAEMLAELVSFDALVNTRLACDWRSDPDLSNYA